MRNSKVPDGPEQELQDLIDEYIAKGGKVTQCPPGPSDEVVYKRSFGMARKKPGKPAKT